MAAKQTLTNEQFLAAAIITATDKPNWNPEALAAITGMSVGGARNKIHLTLKQYKDAQGNFKRPDDTAATTATTASPKTSKATATTPQKKRKAPVPAKRTAEEEATDDDSSDDDESESGDKKEVPRAKRVKTAGK